MSTKLSLKTLLQEDNSPMTPCTFFEAFPSKVFFINSAVPLLVFQKFLISNASVIKVKAPSPVTLHAVPIISSRAKTVRSNAVPASSE